MFNYGSFKSLLLKIFLGIFLIGVSLFLIVSIFTYNPSDPGIGKLVRDSEITNFFGFWGAISSSVFFVLFGKASFVLIFFILYLGVILVLGVNMKRPFLKICLILISVTLINFSLLLQQSYEINAGLFSKILFDICESYLPLLTEELVYRALSMFFFILLSIISLLYCFSIKINFLKNVLFKILKFIFYKPISLASLP